MAKASKKKRSKEKKRDRLADKSKSKDRTKSASAKPVAKAGKKSVAKRIAKLSAKSAAKSTAKAKSKSFAKSAARPAVKLPKAKSKAKVLPVKPAAKVVRPVKPVAAAVKASIKAPTLAPASNKMPAKTLVLTPVKMPVLSFIKAPIKPAPNGVVQVQTKPEKKLEKSMKKSKDADRKGISVPAPVPTDMKPAKNQVGIRTAELEHFRDMLLAKRRELVGDMSSMESEALQRGGNSNLSNLPMHMADMGTDNYEQEFTLGLMEKDRNLLREINNALAKIQDGTFGLCEGTQQAISKPRLEAQPWARYSIEHARKLEQRMGRRM